MGKRQRRRLRELGVRKEPKPEEPIRQDAVVNVASVEAKASADYR